jgi:mono/diheme cytochrome c family protein
MRLTNRLYAATIKATLVVGSVLLALMAAHAAGGDGAQQGPASTPESIAAGKEVFFEYCSGCHGRRADGRGPQSMNLEPRPQNLRNATFVAYLTDERMFTSVSGGVRGTAMPAWEMMITPEKRWQAIHYIRSLTAGDPLAIPNAPTSVVVPADVKNPLLDTVAAVALGHRAWQSYCASCHGTKADGKGRLAESLTPKPRNLVRVVSWGEKPFIDYLADNRVYDSITNGVPGTSMSPWISVLTDSDRWSVILFLRDQARQERERIEKGAQ